jgi:hypothetical protein
MGRRSKKSKRRQPSQTRSQKQYSSAENIVYYFLAAIGVIVLISLVIALLGYFEIF